MSISKIFTDKTAWLIVLIYVVWTRCFNFYLLSNFENWYKIEESIILVLFVVMVPSIFRGLRERTITKNVSLLLIMFALSVVWAFVYWGQGLYQSIRGLTSSCLLLVLYFLFKKKNVGIDSITKAVLILSAIYCFCMAAAMTTFPNCVFGDFSNTLNTAEDFEQTFEQRGAMRLPVPGADLVILAIFIIVSKYKNRPKMYLWLIPLVFFLLQRGTRTPIFMTIGIAVIYRVWSMKNRFLIIAISIILYFVSLTAFNSILKSKSDNIIVKYIQISNEQVESNKSEEDIRVQMATYYLTEFNGDSFLKVITGNGIPNDGAYARAREYLINTRRFFVEDVGFVQIFVWFGLVGLFLYAKLLFKAIKIPRKPEYTYGFLYVIYLFSILPTNSALTSNPIFLSVALYVLYLGERNLQNLPENNYGKKNISCKCS